VHSNGNGGAPQQTAPLPENGRGKTMFAPGPADDTQDDAELDYTEANPFANQAPDWLMDEPAQYNAAPRAPDSPPDPARSNGERHTPEPLPADRLDEPGESTKPASLPLTTAAPERKSVPAPSPAVAPVIQPSPGPKATRLLVTLRRSQSLEADRRRLSDLVDLLERHKGTDRFVIVVEAPGQPRYQLDFPNSTTRICQELKNELSQRLGAGFWRVE
jgi:hypothetical protein